MSCHRRWSPEVIAAVGRLAMTSDRPLSEIARDAGVGQQTACRWNLKYRWRPARADHRGTILTEWAGSSAGPAAAGPSRPSRRQRQAPDPGLGIGPDPAAAAEPVWGVPGERDAPGTGAGDRPLGPGEDVALEPGELLGRLEAATFRAIAVLDTGPAGGRISDPERTARALASLTQTLKIIAGLKGPAREGAECDEAPPRPIEELRDELWRRCARLRAERRSARRAPNVQPG